VFYLLTLPFRIFFGALFAFSSSVRDSVAPVSSPAVGDQGSGAVVRRAVRVCSPRCLRWGCIDRRLLRHPRAAAPFVVVGLIVWAVMRASRPAYAP